MTRALGYSAAAREYESGKGKEKWKAGHRQDIDDLRSQSAQAKVFLQTWGSEMCAVWTDSVILVTSGEIRSFTRRRAWHVCYEAPPEYTE